MTENAFDAYEQTRKRYRWY